MNREIKFRFWLGHTKKMTYEHSLIEISRSGWDFTEDIIPLQYTGLKDKNGKEIYEGDIAGKGYVIMWSEKHALFCEHYYQSYYKEWVEASYPLTADRIEIVGNIYSNPELLNK